MPKKAHPLKRIRASLLAAGWALKGHPIIALDTGSSVNALERISSETILREKLISSISKFISSRSVEGDFNVRELSEQILSSFKEHESRPTSDLFDSLRQDQLSHAWFKLFVLSGLTTRWEYLLRKLADRINIETRITGNAKRSKNKKLEAPSFRKIETIIPEVRKKLPKLRINLEQLLILRGSAVHANFRELRQNYNSQLNNDLKRQNISKTLFMGNFSNAEITDVGSAKSNKEIDQLDDFAFFLETLDSNLITNVSSMFAQACLDLDNLITFTAFEKLKGILNSAIESETLHLCNKEVAVDQLRESSIFRGEPYEFIRQIEKILFGAKQ